MAIATLTVDIVAKLANLQTGFDRAAQIAERNAKRMDAAFAAAARTFGGLVGGLSAGALITGLKGAVTAIDDLAEAAAGVGVGAVALAELRSRAAEAGVEAEQLDNALGKLNAKLIDAASGNKRAAAAFDAMGVAIRDANGNIRSTEQVLRDVADRFATYSNSAEKSALAAELFGERIGRKLVAYLSQGSEGLRQFTGLTEELVADAERSAREIDRLATSFERLKNTLLSGVVPALNSTVDTVGRIDFRKIFEAFRASGTPSAAFVEYFRQLNESAGKTVQAREALARFGATYDEVDRLLRRSPGAKAPVVGLPDPPVIKAASAALRDLNTEIDGYTRQLQRERRSLSDWLGLRDIDEAQQGFRKVEERIARINDLTGRAAANKWAADIALLDDAFFNAEISVEEYEAAIRRATGQTEALADASEKTTDIARELGLTFSSAFEDAIVGGEDLRDVLRGLEKDILRIITRKLVTEPLAGAVSGAVGNFDLGALFGKLFGSFAGGFAVGGFIPPGQWGIAGERGPEIVYGGKAGATVEPSRSAGHTINITVQGNATRDTANQIAVQVGRALSLAGARGFA